MCSMSAATSSSAETKHHVELICGGGPSFALARAIKDAISQQNPLHLKDVPRVTCRIIHIDRETEKSTEDAEAVFVPLEYATITKHNYGTWAQSILGKEKCESLFKEFPPGSTHPRDCPIGTRISTKPILSQIEGHLESHLSEALAQKRQLHVGVCLIPEGPTGTGVAWELIKRLPDWKQEHEARLSSLPGFPQVSISMYLLEVAPADPRRDTEGGDTAGNVLQGAITRKRLSQAQWPFTWLRFDGNKIASTSAVSNDYATRIGAKLMALFLTARFPVQSGQAEQGRTDVGQVLRDMRADTIKPVELIPSTINFPINENICQKAFSYLEQYRSQGNENPPLETPNEIANGWFLTAPNIKTNLSEYYESVRTRDSNKEALEAELKSSGFPKLHWWMASPIGVLLGLFVKFLLPGWLVGSRTGEWFSKWSTLVFIVLISIGLLITGLALLISWGDKNRRIGGAQANLDRALGDVAEKWKILMDSISKELDKQMSFGLDGDGNPIYDGRWYNKYGLTHEEMEKFTNGECLAKFVNNPNKDTLRNWLTSVVHSRITSSNWLETHSSQGAENNTITDANKKYVRIITFSCPENKQVFAVIMNQIQGVTLEAPPTDTKLLLSCLQLVLRSPVTDQHLSNCGLYADAYQKWDRDAAWMRDPAPELGKLL